MREDRQGFANILPRIEVGFRRAMSAAERPADIAYLEAVAGQM